MYDLLFTTPISVIVSLAALAGVTLHDTKLDKLATTFVGIPAAVASTDGAHKGMTSDPHTHVERISLSDVKTSQPRIAPRHGENKKYLLQKNSPKGKHSFDGYYHHLS